MLKGYLKTAIQTQDGSSSQPKAGDEPPTVDLSLFLKKLPTELRNRVWKYASKDTGSHIYFRADTRSKVKLPKEQKLKLDPRSLTTLIRSGWNWHEELNGPKDLGGLIPSPGLLRVSKAICQETIPILYGINSFWLEDTKSLWCFLEGVGEARAWLRKIQITDIYSSESTDSAYTLLAQCARLRNFSIAIDDEQQVYWCDTAEQLAGHFYDDARPWLRGFAVAKGRKFAALEILSFYKDFIPILAPTDYGECARRGEVKKFIRRLETLLASESRLEELP